MTAPLLGAAEAARRILAEVRRQPALRVPLDDALDSVLAEDVVSPIDIPAWTNSAMDGYAARGDDVRGASAGARRCGCGWSRSCPPGAFPTRPSARARRARIFTGAPLPEGADTRRPPGGYRPGRRDGHDRPRPRRRASTSAGVGEDIRRGATVLSAGSALGPAQLGVLASLAVAHPLVYRRPRVAILGSGDEIVDVDQPEEILSGRKIASSNTHTLVALVRRGRRRAGQPRHRPGHAGEPARASRGARSTAICWSPPPASAWASTTTSARVLEELGAEQRFWKLRMRPGAPVGFGLLGGIPWIGLPGNPVSTMVTFELFVRPAIRKMCGHALPFRRAVPVRLAEPSHRSSRSCSISSAPSWAKAADGTGGPAHGPAGLGHPDFDGAGERAARPSGGSIRDACRGRRCRRSCSTIRCISSSPGSKQALGPTDRSPAPPLQPSPQVVSASVVVSVIRGDSCVSAGR